MKDPRGYLQPDEIAHILNACENLRDYVLIRVLAYTGIRISECITIKVSSINDDKSITVIQLKKRGEQYRNVPIDDETYEILKKYVSVKSKKQDDFIFDGATPNSHITRQTAFIIVRKAGKASGINRIGKKGIHPHHFRHSSCMRMIKAGIDIRKVQLLHGHKDYNTTASYLNYGGKEIRDAYEQSLVVKKENKGDENNV